jgi:hypothetical protein
MGFSACPFTAKKACTVASAARTASESAGVSDAPKELGPTSPEDGCAPHATAQKDKATATPHAARLSRTFPSRMRSR